MAARPRRHGLTQQTENFSTHEHHLRSIRDEGVVYSATGDGRIPWISADDIAACAVAALTTPDAPNTDYIIVGQELLSYGDVSPSPPALRSNLLVLIEVSGSQGPHRCAPKDSSP